MNVFETAYIVNESFVNSIKDYKKLRDESNAIKQKAEKEGKIFIQYLVIDREVEFMKTRPKSKANKKMLEKELALLEKNIKDDRYLKEQLPSINKYKKAVEESLKSYE